MQKCLIVRKTQWCPGFLESGWRILSVLFIFYVSIPPPPLHPPSKMRLRGLKKILCRRCVQIFVQILLMIDGLLKITFDESRARLQGT